jgi:hypothetical protein
MVLMGTMLTFRRGGLGTEGGVPATLSLSPDFILVAASFGAAPAAGSFLCGMVVALFAITGCLFFVFCRKFKTFFWGETCQKDTSAQKQIKEKKRKEKKDIAHLLCLPCTTKFCL